VSDLLPIGCPIVVVCKLNDGVGVMPGNAVLVEQRVQEGTEPALLRDPRVEGQCGGCIVAYPHHLGVFSPRFLSLVVHLKASMVVNAEL
jgi:hypothetical protein